MSQSVNVSIYVCVVALEYITMMLCRVMCVCEIKDFANLPQEKKLKIVVSSTHCLPCKCV